MALRVNTRAAREVASLLSQFKDVTPMCDYNDASHSGVQSGGALLPMRQHGSIPPNPTPLTRLCPLLLVAVLCCPGRESPRDGLNINVVVLGA